MFKTLIVILMYIRSSWCLRACEVLIEGVDHLVLDAGEGWVGALAHMEETARRIISYQKLQKDEKWFTPLALVNDYLGLQTNILLTLFVLWAYCEITVPALQEFLCLQNFILS